MDTPTITLADATQAPVQSMERISRALANGSKVYFEPPPALLGFALSSSESDALAGNHKALIDEGVSQVDTYLRKATEVNSNESLSNIGREKALIASRAALCTKIANLYAGAVRLRDSVLAQERALYSPPPAGTALAATLDGEIRTWWRGLGDADRGTWLQKLRSDPTGHDVLQALMRSPVPLGSAETDLVSAAWREGVRSINPVKAVQIDYEKELCDWSIQNMRMCAAIAINAIGCSTQEALMFVMAGGEQAASGALAFGSPVEVHRASLVSAAETRMAA